MLCNAVLLVITGVSWLNATYLTIQFNDWIVQCILAIVMMWTVDIYSLIQNATTILLVFDCLVVFSYLRRRLRLDRCARIEQEQDTQTQDRHEENRSTLRVSLAGLENHCALKCPILVRTRPPSLPQRTDSYLTPNRCELGMALYKVQPSKPMQWFCFWQDSNARWLRSEVRNHSIRGGMSEFNLTL